MSSDEIQLRNNLLKLYENDAKLRIIESIYLETGGGFSVSTSAKRLWSFAHYVETCRIKIKHNVIRPDRVRGEGNAIGRVRPFVVRQSVSTPLLNQLSTYCFRRLLKTYLFARY